MALGALRLPNKKAATTDTERWIRRMHRFLQPRAQGASLGPSWLGYVAVLHAELLIGAAARGSESLSSRTSDAISNEAGLPTSSGVGTPALID